MAFACSSAGTEGSDAAATPTSERDTGRSDSGDALGGACNAIVLGTPVTSATMLASAPPQALGGTIVDGIYEATAVNVFTGSGGAAGQEEVSSALSIRVAGSVWQFAYRDGFPAELKRTTAAVTTAGSTFTETFVCPEGGGGAKTFPYTATATTLQLFQKSSKGTTEIVLTRRGP